MTTETAPAPKDRPSYPDCSGCGHNASGVVANRCTSFVPYPEGDPRGMAGYCNHRCTDDPVIIAWLMGAETPVPAQQEER